MPASDRVRALTAVVLAGWCAWVLVRGRVGRLDAGAAGALAVLAAWWLLQSPAYEGPTVLPLTGSSGLTMADLGVPPSLFLSAAVLWSWWAGRSGESG